MWRTNTEPHLRCMHSMYQDIQNSSLQTSNHNVRVHWWHTRRRGGRRAQSRTLRPTASCVAWRRSKKKNTMKTHPENLTTNGSWSIFSQLTCFLCKQLLKVERGGSYFFLKVTFVNAYKWGAFSITIHRQRLHNGLCSVSPQAKERPRECWERQTEGGSRRLSRKEETGLSAKKSGKIQR